MYASVNYINIGEDNSLSLERHQLEVIISTNANPLSIRIIEQNFNEILTKPKPKQQQQQRHPSPVLI